MIKRLQSRKGFTIVELVVVIAIIGVLAAIMLPMFANSGKPQEAVAKAKSFYYATQSVFIDYKARDTKMTEGYFTFTDGGTEKYAKDAVAGGLGGQNATYLYVVAHAEPEKGFTSVELSVSEESADSPEEGYICMKAPVVQTSGELLDALNGFSLTDDYGYYYALVDSQCRVQACYWSQEYIDVLSDNGADPFKKSEIKFTSNDTIDDIIVGAFPASFSASGESMFMAA